MPITPTGAPAWVRTNDHSSYGGNINKRNYLDQGVVDAQTDVGADEFCRLAADVAALIRTSPACTLTYLCNDTTPAAPTIESATAMWAAPRTSSYEGDDAPSGYPSAARNGNGDVTFTFASSYTDDYGVSGSLAIAHAIASAHVASAVFRNVTVEISGQTVRVRVLDESAAAVSDPRITLTVW